MAEKLRVAVIPPGAFGTALTFPLAESDSVEELTLCFRSTEDYRNTQKTRENKKHLAGVTLHKKVHLTDSFKEGLHKVDVIVIVAPIPKLTELCETILPYKPQKAVVVNAGKGIEEETNRRAFQIIHNVDQSIDKNSYAALSGPNFAFEVATRQPTLTVIASENEGLRVRLQKLFRTPRFLPYGSDDVIGVELGGALKNPMAMLVGISAGLGLGENIAAALRNRGLWEMTRLAMVLGAKDPMTIIGGLSGQSDLDLSSRQGGRNYDAGVAIGRGEDPILLLQSKRTIEGLHTIRPAVSLARENHVEVPLLDYLFNVIYEGRNPNALLDVLIKGNHSFEAPPPILDNRFRWPLRILNKISHRWQSAN